MERKKVIIVAGFLIIGIIFLLFAFNSPPRLLGFAIYEGSCEGSINEEGLWELNGSLECGSLGITINSSNVTLECNSYPIIGDSTSNSTGISISASLENITMQNCNITNFGSAIAIGSESNLNILNSHAEGENCVSGNWTDLGGNTGCLDTIGPEITLVNQTIYQTQSLLYQINASDNSGIANFSADDSQNFSINSTGFLTNLTYLQLLNYTLNITAKDVNNYSSSGILLIEVLPVQDEEENNNDNGNNNDNNDDNNDDDNDDNDNSDSESSGSNSPPQPILCGDAWNCTGWSECADEEQTRTCTKVKSWCSDAMPETGQACQSSQLLGCEPDWECTWNKCIDGTRTPIECKDLNECGLEQPVSEECQEQKFGLSLITSKAINVLSRAGIKISAEKIKENLVFLIMLFLAVFLLLIIIMHRRKFLRQSAKSLSQNKNNLKEDDRQKL